MRANLAHAFEQLTQGQSAVWRRRGRYRAELSGGYVPQDMTSHTVHSTHSTYSTHTVHIVHTVHTLHTIHSTYSTYSIFVNTYICTYLHSACTYSGTSIIQTNWGLACS